MEHSTNPTQIVKLEQMETSTVEVNIEDNIVIDENSEIIGLHAENLHFEIYDAKNFEQNEIIVKNSQNFEEDAPNLRKEYTLLSEKFAILEPQVQQQAKLIEYLIRLDMVKNSDEIDKKELEDLHRKIRICSSVIDANYIKYNELCSEKRRVLISNPTEPEKKSAIWDHFTMLSDSDGQRNAECNYCKKCFSYNLSTNKCREHIFDHCEKAPEFIKMRNKDGNTPQQKSRYSVWNYFLTTEKNGKSSIACRYCGIEYSSRNATKCREHLAFKCQKIEEDVKEQMKNTFSQNFINSVSSNKRSSIWEHFQVTEEDDKNIIQCIYCCMTYANKNATKCREHLLERCDKIPAAIRHKINHAFYESPLKTWTQIKVPIWKHFTAYSFKENRKQYKCNYCNKVYTSKNVTKFRIHLLSKCQAIGAETKAEINADISRLSIKGSSEQNDVTLLGDGSHTDDDDDDDPMDSSNDATFSKSDQLEDGSFIKQENAKQNED